MRSDRLLKGGQRGSAALETVFSIVFVMWLALGVMEVAFVVYGRNVMAASTHEGARAAVELGAAPSDAETVATQTVQRAAGRLVQDLDVTVSTYTQAGSRVVHVRARGALRPFGPVPLPMVITTSATATRAAGL